MHTLMHMFARDASLHTTRASASLRRGSMEPSSGTPKRDDLSPPLGITFASDDECVHVLMCRLMTPS